MIKERRITDYIAACDRCGVELSTAALNTDALTRFARAARWLEPEPGAFICHRCQVLEKPTETTP
jgi:hypothetical protein